MNKLSLALTGIMLLGLVAFMAPNIFALNRGNALRNIALWLAIFAGLGLLYQLLYSDHPPEAMQKLMRMRGAPMQQQEEAPPPAPGDKSGGHYNFTPPGE
jgi:hypothetical protein